MGWDGGTLDLELGTAKPLGKNATAGERNLGHCEPRDQHRQTL